MYWAGSATGNRRRIIGALRLIIALCIMGSLLRETPAGVKPGALIAVSAPGSLLCIEPARFHPSPWAGGPPLNPLYWFLANGPRISNGAFPVNPNCPIPGKRLLKAMLPLPPAMKELLYSTSGHVKLITVPVHTRAVLLVFSPRHSCLLDKLPLESGSDQVPGVVRG